MGTIAGRYDAAAEAYETWWAPVLRPSALRLLDLAEPLPRGGTATILDVGTGSGTLALAAIRRWPRARAVGIDGSRGMLGAAEAAAASLPPADRRRLSLVEGLAERIPLDDGSVDVVVSSFVLQLVPSRARALAEARRVLVPGGTLAFVTWRATDGPVFGPDDVFYEVLDDLGIPDELEAEEARTGDPVSAAAAVAQVRRAGFRDVTGHEELLVHRYDPAAYPRFLEEYAERETFEGLEPAVAAEVRALATERLAALARRDPDAFVWRSPIVYVRGTRPPAPRPGRGGGR
jgi:SAM-dependent methyltransferase